MEIVEPPLPLVLPADEPRVNAKYKGNISNNMEKEREKIKETDTRKPEKKIKRRKEQKKTETGGER